MAKQLPLTRRLELALQESSSNSEINSIYGQLNSFIKKNIDKFSKSEDFYRQLNQNTLSPTYNRKKFSSNEIEEGKMIAHNLQESVVLPEINEPKYRLKMIDAMKFEYKILKEI